MSSLRRIAKALEKQARRRWRDAAAASSPGPGRFKVEVMSTFEALADPRFGNGVAELMTVAAASALTGEGARSCYICDRAWSPHRTMVAVMTVEFLNRADGHGLVAGVCPDCAAGDLHAAVLRTLQRDLGADPGSVQVVHPEARA